MASREIKKQRARCLVVAAQENPLNKELLFKKAKKKQKRKVKKIGRSRSKKGCGQPKIRSAVSCSCS